MSQFVFFIFWWWGRRSAFVYFKNTQKTLLEIDESFSCRKLQKNLFFVVWNVQPKFFKKEKNIEKRNFVFWFTFENFYGVAAVLGSYSCWICVWWKQWNCWGQDVAGVFPEVLEECLVLKDFLTWLKWLLIVLILTITTVTCFI